MAILPLIHSFLKINDNQPYLAVHWRRGDQLKFRCGKLDKSVNCGHVDEFLTSLKSTREKFIPNDKMPITTYVATNEIQTENINKIEKENMLLFSHIRPELEKLQLTTLDIFVVELMIMCYADYFMSWGVSSVSTFICKCRKLYPDKKMMTIFNNEIREVC